MAKRYHPFHSFIRDLCASYLRVELLYGRSMTCVDERDGEKAARELTLEDFQGGLSMGDSCGPRDERYSGTLGGAIKLRHDKQDLGTFALTNSHVVRSYAYEEGKIYFSIS